MGIGKGSLCNEIRTKLAYTWNSEKTDLKQRELWKLV